MKTKKVYVVNNIYRQTPSINFALPAVFTTIKDARAYLKQRRKNKVYNSINFLCLSGPHEVTLRKKYKGFGL